MIAFPVFLYTQYDIGMRTDFEKFATGKLGINSMVLDDVIKAQAQYLNPYILEERPFVLHSIGVLPKYMGSNIALAP